MGDEIWMMLLMLMLMLMIINMMMIDDISEMMNDE